MAFENNPTEGEVNPSDVGVGSRARWGVRAVWAAAAAGIVLAACLCGFAAGSILISAGVSAYSGWSGVAVTRLVVTVAFVSGPTYTPLPTYTPQPTYTLQPTYTPQPSPEAAALPPTPDAVSSPVQPSETPPPPPADAASQDDIQYEVAEGDTVESVAAQLGADIVPMIIANDLDPDNPTLQAGETITVPFKIAPLCLPANEPVDAEVVGVFDGDTIETAIGGQNYTVRYLGVDAPSLEPNPAPYSTEARDENQNLVDGLTVSLVQDVTQADASNRLLRYVLIGDTFVNYELVRQGFARVDFAAPDTACEALLTLAENQASREQLGLWAQGGPGTPGAPNQTPPPGAGTPPGGPPYGPPTPSAGPTSYPAGWSPPPSLTPTSTSSLGFKCQCSGKFVWGNFANDAQADVCAGICAIAATRQAAQCIPELGLTLGCAP